MIAWVVLEAVGSVRRVALLFALLGLAVASGTAKAQQSFFLQLAESEQGTDSVLSFLPQQAARTDDGATVGPSSDDYEAPFYKIGVGDTLRIVVWRFPDLSTSVIVRPDGLISVPLVEDLRVAGLTPAEVGEAIEERLGEFVQDPIVTLIVDGPVGTFDQQVRVIGEAVQPRALPWSRGLRLADVMVAVGGLAPNADGNSATLLRHETRGLREAPLRIDDLLDRGDVTANIEMQPGDVIIIPEGFFHGDWSLQFQGNADITYTDNVDLDPSGERDTAVIVRAGPGISLTANAARIQGSLAANIFLVNEISNSNELSLDGNLVGTTTAELVEQNLFFDASASVSRILVNSRDGQSASDTNTGDTEIVQAYRASPYLITRFGNFASNELRYTASATFISGSSRGNNNENSNGNGSDTIGNEITTTLDSGRDFSFFNWTFFGRAGRETSDNNSDITRYNADYSLQYPLPFERRLAVQGSIGYRVLDEDDNTDDDDIRGMTWRTGLNWRPNPRFEATAGVGRDGENIVWDADIRWDATPRLTLGASYEDTTSTQQDRLVQRLPTVDQGVADFRAQPNSFSIDDGLTRTRTVRAGAVWSRRNVDATLDLSYSEESDNASQSTGTDERNYEGETSLVVGLSSDLDFSARFLARLQQFDEVDSQDDEVTLLSRVGFEYQVTGSFETSLFYAFSNRIADREENEYRENAVILSGSVAF